MHNAIEAGSILIEKGALIPSFRLPPDRIYLSGWMSLSKLNRSGFEKNISKAGWTFFYPAGEIRATVFGFDEQKMVLKAVERLVTSVKAHHFNSLEITRVVMRSFLGVSYTRVIGRARHIQKDSVSSQRSMYEDSTATGMDY